MVPQLHSKLRCSSHNALNLPVLYMVGKSFPQSALGVARLLTVALTQVEDMAFDGLGHMGPVTHPKLVNATIADFLNRHVATTLSDGDPAERRLC